MDYDAYRDDQVNTGVIAALIGGFALGNIWEQELESNVDVRNPLSPTTSLVQNSLILPGIACARRARRADKMPAALSHPILMNLHTHFPLPQPQQIAAYVLSITAVHACTCSALTSAFLYRILTSHNDEKAVAWAHNHALLMKLPFYKFVMGTLCKFLSRILSPITHLLLFCFVLFLFLVWYIPPISLRPLSSSPSPPSVKCVILWIHSR